MLIFLCYIVNDIANIMMEYLTYLITILIVFETSLSEVILYLCLIWSHIKLQYLSTYQRWYLCLKKQICNEFKKMNDTFKIKNTCYQRVSVIFSSMCSYFSAMSWMILSKDLDRSRFVTNSRKWTTPLKLKIHVSTDFLSSSVLCAHISLLCRGWYCQKIWIEADM